MKKIIILILSICFTLVLFAEFNTSNLFLSSDDVEYRSQFSSYSKNDIVYFLYEESGMLKFAFSQDNGVTFGYTNIDNFTKCFTDFQASMTVDSNDNIVIIYQKPLNIGQVGLMKAFSDNHGNSFETEIFSNNLHQIHGIANLQNSIYIYASQNGNFPLSTFFQFSNTEEFATLDNEYRKINFIDDADSITGRIHSNGDIHYFSSNNNSIFNDLVSTSGELVVDGNHYLDIDETFAGGFVNNIGNFSGENLDAIRQNGYHPIPSECDITKVVINGATGSTIVGDIQFVELKPFNVYSWYPHNSATANLAIGSGANWFKDSDLLWTNYVAIYDTLWCPGPAISLCGTSAFMDCELWIEGNVAGRMTYGSSDDVYITGDITYAGTSIGTQPDNPDNPNLTDLFGLASEKSINIKYKHHDPINQNIEDENTNGIMLYGAYAAIKTPSDENLHNGNFSVEYLHPHGSTPNFWGCSPSTGNDTLFYYIDFHKYIFPTNVEGIPTNIEGFKLHSNNPIADFQTCGFPYEDPNYINSFPNVDGNYVFPYGTDFPWYNPVWPEKATDIVFDRGTFTLFGSLAQTRAGLTHVSGTNPSAHQDNAWDIGNFLYGGEHADTGYELDFHYDTNLKNNIPTDFPVTKYNGETEISRFGSINSNGGFSSIYNANLESYAANKLMGKYENQIAYFYGSGGEYSLYLFDSDNSFHVTRFHNLPINLDITDIVLTEDKIYIASKNPGKIIACDFSPDYSDENYIYETITTDYSPVDIAIDNTGEMVYVKANVDGDELTFEFFKQNTYNYFVDFFSHTIDLDSNNFEVDNIIFDLDENNKVSIIYNNKIDNNYYYLSGSIDNFTPANNEVVEIQKTDMSCYPNPFNPDITISYNIKDDNQNVKIDIINIKGQIVKSYRFDQQEKGSHSVMWDGNDKNNKKVSTGTYFSRLSLNGKPILSKKITMIK